MSIVNMQRVAIIGLDTEKEKLMSQLMDFGAVEFTDQSDKFEEEIWRRAVVQDENQDAVTALEGKINHAEQALEVFEKYNTGKNPLFKTRRAIAEAKAADAYANLDKAHANVDKILSLNEKLHRATDQLNKLETDRLSLLPWMGYDLPLEVQTTQSCGLHLGVLPVVCDTAAIASELETKTSSLSFKHIGSDKDLHYVAFIVTKDVEEEVLATLKQKGFAETTFKDFEGTVKENLQQIQQESKELQAEFAGIEAEIAANSNLKEPIEEYFDLLNIQADKEKIKTKLLKTKRTFFIEGWIPEGCVTGAQTILDENQCYYMFRKPEDGEEVPVIINNSDFFTPFEAITEMYSLPDYRGFDPTSIFAAFYAIFFGMMLSDAGYGIVMAVACFVVLKKFDLEGTMYKMVKLFFYCGISTTFWGAMFGGWFGDFVQVFTGTILGNEIEINPIWFNPIEDPMTLLIFSIALGVIHVFLGMGIRAYMQIKAGNWFDAICDEGFWYVTILGLLAWLGGSSIADGLTTIGMWMTIIGALGLLLTGGRHNKGIGKVTGGLGTIYNITSYLSDILSYARLLALGLATGVIAQVVNTMGSMAGGGVVGAIVLLIAFVVGHTLNLAINALGAFIHSSRLQYIEFFGKFYEDGGEPFKPFRRNTKYIKFTENER